MEITRVSTKGQIVIPQEIRKELGIESGTSMLVTKMKDYVVLRKMNMPNVQQAFKSIANEIEKQFKSNKITRKDINGAVSWARKG